MSICKLGGLNAKFFYRQAFVLAGRARYLPGIGSTNTTRLAHSSLYQMVKRRTLEARAKLQPNKFPNNQPCVTPKNPPKPVVTVPFATSSQKPPPHPPSPKPCPTRSPTPPLPHNYPSQKPSPSSSSVYPPRTQSSSSSYVCPPRFKPPTSPAGCASPSQPPPPSQPPSSSSSDCPPPSQPPSSSSACPPPSQPPSSSSQYTTVPIKCAKEDRAKGEKDRQKISYNAQVLNVARCTTNTKPCGEGSKSGVASVKGGGDGSACSTGSGSGSGSGKGSDKVCSSDNKQTSSDDGGFGKNSKLWLAVLAAIGAGGLLVWLLTRGGKKRDSDCDQSAAVVPVQTVPATSGVLPTHVPYLLIGGGTAAFSAFRAIKSNDAKAKVLMITNEHRKPYMRPPLSKELWYSAKQVELTKDYRFKQWTGAERSLFFEPEEFFIDPTKLIESSNGGIAVAHGFTVRKIDPVKQIVTLTDGYEIGYDECLIATGSSPKNLDVFNEAPMSVREKVMLYRTPEDFERLKRFVDQKKTITILGNGFIGSELACSLANYSKEKDVKIYQAFPETGVMSKVLPDYLSRWTTRKVEEQGVCVLPNAGVKSAQRDNSMLKVTLNNGKTLLSDVVVVCVGCQANTSLAHISGLEVDRGLGGFVVNAELEARSSLYVAGDAACFYDPLLGRRRVEHHDHSVVSGRLAGENMVGHKKAYTHQSMFWSDLGPEIGYEGIGLVDASLPTVAVFAASSKIERKADNLAESRPEATSAECVTDNEEMKCDDDAENYGRGVIFYLKDDKIVGILLWNLFNRIGLARTIINQNRKFHDLNEVAKLFEIHA